MSNLLDRVDVIVSQHLAEYGSRKHAHEWIKAVNHAMTVDPALEGDLITVERCSCTAVRITTVSKDGRYEETSVYVLASDAHMRVSAERRRMTGGAIRAFAQTERDRTYAFEDRQWVDDGVRIPDDGDVCVLFDGRPFRADAWWTAEVRILRELRSDELEARP